MTLYPEHYKGAESEHIAAAYYLSKARQVYWPAVQQGCIDFIVEDQSQFRRVQVKTATWMKSGTGMYLQCRTRLTNKYQAFTCSDLYDILFVVGPDGELWEIPAEKIQSSNLSLKRSSGKSCEWDDYRVN